MAGIMGLISEKEFSDNSFHSFNNRRQTFWNYPEGAATLSYLLSLMDSEPTDTPLNFGWEEIRYAYIRTQTAGGDGPFSASGSDTAASSPMTITQDTEYRVEVDDTSNFQVNDSIIFVDMVINGTTNLTTIRGVVSSIVSSTKLEFRALHTVTNVVNTLASTVDKNVAKIGSAYAEGSTSGQGRMLVPVEPTNNTQIFKDPVEFTGSALKIPTDFDKTGAYKTKAKTTALDHVIGQEMALLFGKKHTFNSALAAGGSFGGATTPTRTMGGILHFLEEWEATGGGAAGYRPGGAALTADTADDKRIIENSTGTMTSEKWDEYTERVFRKANTQSREKICLVGNGAAKAINQLIKREIVREIPATDRGDTWRMRVKSVETSWGTLHFKTHPLLTDTPGLFYAMFIIDVPFLKYRPLNDRDMVKLNNRQSNDEDGRKDLWLTEAGLELQFPEAHMLIKNVQKIV